ncbi:MAG TPA: PAS domain-containing protein [Candidatus Acidoferrum sp.]|nr:PAS domain-containing protein [Candidatus Acidoferrum sp.]
MIIRLLRGRVPDGRHEALLERLRALVAESQRPAGMLSGSVGFRRDGDELHFLALSTWESLDAISDRTGGQPGLPIFEDAALIPEVTIDLFEMADESADTDPVAVEGSSAIGLMLGRVERHAESTAHEMIRAIAPEVRRAGVTALHVGRRLQGDRVEVLAVAMWRDRLSLHRFGKSRTTGTLDPAFLRLMTEWRFETYDSIDVGQLGLPASGPAILLADDQGRYVDASPGVEALLGIPAELILRQTIADLTGPADAHEVSAAWAAFLKAGHAEGTWTLIRADGRSVTVGFRAQADCPSPGIHASVLSRLGAPVDDRPVEAIVEESFPSEVLV